MQVGGKFGMTTLETSVVELVNKRAISLEDARERLPGSEVLNAMAAAQNAARSA
jgi:Tfp pilus assembly pilus retraction ATPase PilT